MTDLCRVTPASLRGSGTHTDEAPGQEVPVVRTPQMAESRPDRTRDTPADMLGVGARAVVGALSRRSAPVYTWGPADERPQIGQGLGHGTTGKSPRGPWGLKRAKRSPGSPDLEPERSEGGGARGGEAEHEPRRGARGPRRPQPR
ncbi:hypothetical protein DB30_07640 [Enhygromyxa salina]|uniref:Uncharacterized protein n=1 Tax=Enhygromyxa salina TaxID=215803 RepID=A0A0C1Z839_9BACT|nr:hypothetical protein DB30_07640 [Enhygromyxa salina]